MSWRKLYITFITLFVLGATGVFAQVYIGDGLKISEGTQIMIQNQDVIFDTDEIKGEGNLQIQHHKNVKISVLKNLNADANIQIEASVVDYQGDFGQKFAARNLPKLTEEIIAAAKKEETEGFLIRYINTEGLVYDTPNEEPSEPTFDALPTDVADGIMISEVLRLQAADFLHDYIIPIYSITLNDERFSDYAELYEFESLTAIWKPPTA